MLYFVFAFRRIVTYQASLADIVYFLSTYLWVGNNCRQSGI